MVPISNDNRQFICVFDNLRYVVFGSIVAKLFDTVIIFIKATISQYRMCNLDLYQICPILNAHA